MKPWRRVAIIGVGLIGGSIGRALLQRKLAVEVVGIGRRAATLRAAKQLGAVTATTTQFASGVEGADLVIVCTPVDLIVDHVRAAAKGAGKTLITDVGSTKRLIVERLAAAQAAPDWPPTATFVGSHPLAGGENAGVRHSRHDLLVGRTVVVTPTATDKPEKVRAIERLWKSLGAKVVKMSADEHDRAVAVTSHLPHLAASMLAAATPEHLLSLTGAGWRDTTRVAAGDPTLWQQILLTNREHVLLSLEQFAMIVAQFRAALDAADRKALERLLAEAKRIRDAVAS